MNRDPSLQGVPVACIEVADNNVKADDWTIDGYPRLIYGQLTAHVHVDLPDSLPDEEAETVILHSIFARGWEYGQLVDFEYDEFCAETEADEHARDHYTTAQDVDSLDSLSRTARDAIKQQPAGGLGGSLYDVTVTLGAKYTVPMQWSEYEIKQTMIALVRKHSYGAIHEWDPTPISSEHKEYADLGAQGTVSPRSHYETPNSNDEYIF